MKSMISDSLDEPTASKPMGLMRNDHSCCHGSNPEDEGSRGGSASLPTHSTSPSSPTSPHVVVSSLHRVTIRHICGAAGSQRRSSHRSAPQSAST